MSGDVLLVVSIISSILNHEARVVGHLKSSYTSHQFSSGAEKTEQITYLLYLFLLGH